MVVVVTFRVPGTRKVTTTTTPPLSFCHANCLYMQRHIQINLVCLPQPQEHKQQQYRWEGTTERSSKARTTHSGIHAKRHGHELIGRLHRVEHVGYKFGLCVVLQQACKVRPPEVITRMRTRRGLSIAARVLAKDCLKMQRQVMSELRT